MKSQQGFTLIEIIVVLFFMVVAAAMAIPRFSGFLKAEQARDTARNVASMVRECRMVAIEKQRTVTLQFVPSMHAFVATFDDTLIPRVTASGNQAVGVSANGSSGVGGSFGGGYETGRPPRYPVAIPATISAIVQTIDQTAATTANGGTPDPSSLSFGPDGQAPDGDIVLIFGAGGGSNGLRIAVRHQGTQIRIEDAATPDMPTPGSMISSPAHP